MSLLSTGCPPPQPAPVPPPPRPTELVLETVRENLAAVRRPLMCPLLYVSASLRDAAGRRRAIDVKGRLILQSPDRLWLRLYHDLESQLMELGANEREYWVSIWHHDDTLWWGRRAYAGRACVDPPPVDVARIADVLAGLHLGDSPDQVGPLRRTEERFDRLLYGRREPGGSVAAEREYFVDRFEPHLVRRVVYFDSLGREDLVVLLDDYDAVPGTPARFPRRITAQWPLHGDRMALQLESMRLPERIHPRTFERPAAPPPGIRRVVQVDADCDDWPASQPDDPAAASTASGGE